ncbi:MAG: DnaD domain-containing protein [Chloroflexota bacterium]
MRESTRQFPGFPARGLAFTPIPSVLVSHLLAGIDDLAELKVTLYLFWALHRQRGPVRCLRWEQLREEGAPLCGLGEQDEDALAGALERAVARGTVLHLAMETDAGREDLYFLNTGEGRRTAERVRCGEAVVPPAAGQQAAGRAPGVRRSALAGLYEQQVGVLSPMIVQEREYGPEEVADAIGEAVRYNRRRWAYVRSVLENRHKRAGGSTENG